MFIKVTKSGKYRYAQLVESYREEGKTRHRVMFNLGRVDQIENNPGFQRMAERLAELSTLRQDSPKLEDVTDAEISNYGYLAYRKLWQQFDIPELLNEIKGQVKYDLEQASFLMAVQHLLNPCSKLGTFEHQEHYFNLEQVELHHLYRSLDILDQAKEKLEAELFKRNYNLFNMKVDVVFFDVTTFSFESVQQDSLRDFGFSKDGKFKEVQVVMALLVDQDGRPVGYELFPGNTFESKTLEKALDKLERRFGINRIIIVADRGINSKLNLKSIRDKGYGYVVACRLRKLPKKIQEEALDESGFKNGYNVGEPVFRYKSIDYLNRFKDGNNFYELPEKLIISYSETRAKKDQADRERLVDKAKKLLQEKSKIKAQNKRGGKKYLTETNRGSTDWILDEKAIFQDACFDGYYAVQTSEPELSASGVLSIYSDLWKIEESFRVMKSTLEVRPVFHWTESRIKGHFVICFLAFMLERTLEVKLSEAEIDASPERIREALNSLNFTQVAVQDRKFLIKTKATSLAHDIWRLLRLKPPKNVTPLEDIEM